MEGLAGGRLSKSRTRKVTRGAECVPAPADRLTRQLTAFSRWHPATGVARNVSWHFRHPCASLLREDKIWKDLTRSLIVCRPERNLHLILLLPDFGRTLPLGLSCAKVLNSACLHGVHRAGLLVGAGRRLPGTRRVRWLGAGRCPRGPCFAFGRGCGADAGWGLRGEGTRSCAQSFPKAGCLCRDSGESPPAERPVGSGELTEVSSGALPGRRARRSRPAPAAPLLPGLFRRLFWTELSWDVAAAQSSTKSSARVFSRWIQR